jgi:predicted transcriptional regulator
MPKTIHAQLSRRESQIIDAVYQLGEASVSDILQRMDDPPSYDSVRIILGILTEKGHLKHYTKNRRYIYQPTVPRGKASRSAIQSLIHTFFGGSPSKAILTLLDMSSDNMSAEELEQIAARIEKDKKS